MESADAVPSIDLLMNNMKNEIKKQIDYKYEETLHKMEVASRLIFKFIPQEVLSLPATELQKCGYDLVQLINESNQRTGKKEKRITFLPLDVAAITAEIEQEIKEEKKLATQQKKHQHTPNQQMGSAIPFKGHPNGHSARELRAKTPKLQKHRDLTPDAKKPNWRF